MRGVVNLVQSMEEDQLHFWIQRKATIIEAAPWQVWTDESRPSNKQFQEGSVLAIYVRKHKKEGIVLYIPLGWRQLHHVSLSYH